MCIYSSIPRLHRNQVTDVTSMDLRCYTSETDATASTLTVEAGKELSFQVGNGLTIYHQGVVNVYMAKAPSDVNGWAGDGAVWFKVYQISAVTNGGQSITFPAEGMGFFSCPLFFAC